MKKITAVLVLLIMILSLFACEYAEEREHSALPQSKDPYDDVNSELPDYSIPDDVSEPELDLGTFIVACNANGVFYQDENVPGTISAAIEERNAFIKEKYNVSVSSKTVSEKKIAEYIKNSLESNIPYADLLAYPADVSVGLMLSGLLGDFNSLNGFDINAPYFENINAKTLATNSTLYLIPDETALVYDDAYVLFYNRKLLEGKTSENPETLAAQGKWTWDKFLEIAKSSATAFGKSAADLKSDIFGYGAYYLETVYSMAMWTSTGNRVVDYTYKNPVDIVMSSDKMVEITNNLNKALNTRGKYPNANNDASEVFKSGRMVFFCNKMQYFYGLRNGTVAGAEYGVLPMPKYNESQDRYYCLVDNSARVLSIPKNLTSANENLQKRDAAVISALCATGNKTIKDAYINSFVALYLFDNSETLMIKTITDSVAFDFTYVYGSKISEIKRCPLAAITDFLDFGSNVGTTISRYKGNFDKYCAEHFK